MWRRLMVLTCLASMLGIAGPASAALIAHWPLNGDAKDVADGHHGTLVGNAAFVKDADRGTVLRVDGASGHIEVPNSPDMVFNASASYTIMAWAFVPQVTAGWHGLIAKSRDQGTHYGIWITDTGQWMGGGYDNRGSRVVPQVWVHIAYVQNGAAGTGRTYIDGAVDWSGGPRDGSGAGNFWIGGAGGVTEFFNGLIDDVKIYNHALTVAEVQEAMKSGALAGLADGPSPADKAVDVPRDATLNWTAGQYPATHDVYVGTTFADVNSATRTNTTGILASKGQADTTFDPAGVFAYGQTYFWRIDEVNTSADGTIYKGAVWSFTAEPYGYPITAVTATASSSAANMGPEKTVDGSGLTGDLHGTEGITMWMSGGVKPNWIQYQFDKVYKLNDLTVWNSNQLIESFLGFGAKNVTIETSTDGTTWTALASVPEFAKATGLAGYAANTTVSLGGVMAKYVKLTINSNWGGMAPQTGLSEVRFSYVPAQARIPQPANAATGVKIDTTLNWRPGREAGSHQVYFGADQAAVTNGTVAAQTAADHSFTPSSLNFGTTYYWRVDEVNTVTYPGDVWSFTTQEYSAVDDFESYTDDEGSRIYEAWIDGWTNGSGSVVGHLQAPFAEQTILHGGKQSMPMEYNNIKTPFYSEASRTFDTNQSWTTNGADTLSLWFRGNPAAFLDKGNNVYTVSASGTDIWNNGDQFRFAYKSLSGNGSITMRVESIGNTDVWAKVGPMIRETLDAGSRNAYIAVTPGSGVSFQWRDTTNGASANSQTVGLVAPYWVRITRTGNVFKAERSPDGKTWTPQGVDTTISMTANVFIGLAVTSHNATLTTVGEVSNVSIAGTVTGVWQALAIGMTMASNDAAPLYVTVEDKAGKKKTVVNANAAAATVAAWTEWRIPLSDLSAGGVNLTTVKKITVGVGDQASPKAGGAGHLYIDDLGFGKPAATK